MNWCIFGHKFEWNTPLLPPDMLVIKSVIKIPGAIWCVTPLYAICTTGWNWHGEIYHHFNVIDVDTGDHYYSDCLSTKPAAVCDTFSIGDKRYSLDYIWDKQSFICLYVRSGDWLQLASVDVSEYMYNRYAFMSLHGMIMLFMG